MYQDPLQTGLEISRLRTICYLTSVLESSLNL